MVNPRDAFQADPASGRPWAEMTGRFLNHGELVYAPGDRDLAAEFFTLLGFEVKDIGLRWILLGVDGPGQDDFSNNALYASEIVPEQREVAEALSAAAQANPEATAKIDAYVARRLQNPQTFPHFGIRMSEAAQTEILARIGALTDSALKDRIEVRIFSEDDPETVAPGMRQAFIYTDIVSYGVWPMGMILELQVVMERESLLA